MGKSKKNGKTVLGAEVENTEDIDIDDVEEERAPEEIDEDEKESRVMYIGELPYGFFEQEIKKYFGQFGEVLKVRLSRSLKTHNCKGYGWVEFRYPSVARIAAEAMNGYMMFKKRLVCRIVEKDKIHKDLFKGHDKKFMLKPPIDPSANKFKPRSSIAKQRFVQRMKQLDKKRKQKLEMLGIDYQYTSYKDLFEQKRKLRKQREGGKEEHQQNDQKEEIQINSDAT
eukprot:TRINITY_DN1302_c0_g2_i1.p1 TRINITY_DN1302_c0_g2~~TRINITY_DN1302_c0_g2_i1.p1  ORF type:complete len:226 (-),score=40.41 TRINITY_DN1302_c0_g2_i1:317-994(-)